MVKWRSSCLAFLAVTLVSVLVLLALVLWSASRTPDKFLLIAREGFQDYQPNCLLQTSRCGGLQHKPSVVKGGRQTGHFPSLAPDSSRADPIRVRGKCGPQSLQCGGEQNEPLKIDNHSYVEPAMARDANQHLGLESSGENTHFTFSTVREKRGSPYHDWDSFQEDFDKMLQLFRVYVYPDVHDTHDAFSKVFTPHKNPLDPNLGNYFSEHMFKLNLLNSSFLTSNPEEAHFFFLPFSVNVLRNDPRVKTEESIANFVAQYVEKVSLRFDFWNRTQGADHFYVCCHSVGRTAASKMPSLQRNSVQVVCSSNCYHKSYVPHKDVAMPQVWPRAQKVSINPPSERTRLAFYAGRAQNSQVRERLLHLWSNDSDLDIHSGKVGGSYEEAFQRTKFCLHVKGYEVNTARISDAIHFGCVPVIISDQYDLPLANVLDWKKFSIILSHVDIPYLKNILLSVSNDSYQELHKNVCQVREHFQWQAQPSGYDSFHMTMYQLWLKRGIVRPL